MKRVLYAVVISMAFAGCTGNRHATTKVQSDSAKIVGVMPFSTVSGGTGGQEAADSLSLKLLEKGYTVIDRSRTTAMISEKKFYESGLTDDVRSILQNQEVAAIVYGSITEYGCETRKKTSLFGGTSVPRNYCTVSLTAKMADTATGKLLWALMLQDSAEAADLSVPELMRSLMERTDIVASLPSASAEAPLPETKPQPAK